MTQEEKELLLKDLCGRLPYRMRFKTEHGYDTLEDIDCFDLLDIRINTGNEVEYSLDEIKPYLFPLSSMTEEQDKEYFFLCEEYSNYGTMGILYFNSIKSIDWFNKNHLDYRNLIDKNLAIDATNLNIY